MALVTDLPQQHHRGIKFLLAVSSRGEGPCWQMLLLCHLCLLLDIIFDKQWAEADPPPPPPRHVICLCAYQLGLLLTGRGSKHVSVSVCPGVWRSYAVILFVCGEAAVGAGCCADGFYSFCQTCSRLMVWEWQSAAGTAPVRRITQPLCSQHRSTFVSEPN